MRPPVGPALAPLATLYGGAVRLRNALYDAGLMTSHRLPAPVISIGNLTVGGTGKTPLTRRLAADLLALGHRPAILLRGYAGANAGRRGHPALVVSRGDGSGIAPAAEAGDEAVLLARALPRVPVVVCPDRRRAGAAALALGGVDLLLLDDGFQHRALQRDADLLVLDAGDPFGGGRLLPAGLLREPVSGLRRAHAAVLTRAEDRTRAQAVVGLLERLAPDLPVFLSRHLPSGLLWADGRRDPAPGLADLAGRPVAAFAGLARPQVLSETLERLGARVVAFTPLPDHHPFAAGEVASLAAAASRAGADWLITTAKDAARLEPGSTPPDLLVLGVDLAIDEESRLLHRLLSLCLLAPRDGVRSPA